MSRELSFRELQSGTVAPAGISGDKALCGVITAAVHASKVPL